MIIAADILLANISLLMTYVNRYFNRQFITRKPVNRQILDKVTAALDQYYQKPDYTLEGLPSVSYLADKVCLSPKYMSDVLKSETGFGAQDTIHKYVLNLAKHRLLQSDHSVSNVALSLGFEYSQYFSRIFKKHVGMSPTAFRKQS